VIGTRQQNGFNDGPWYNWRVADGLLTSVALAHNKSDRVQILGTNAKGQAFYRSQTTPGAEQFGPWTTFAVPRAVTSLTATTTPDGRIAVFALDTAGRVWASAQGSPNDNNWSAFLRLDGFGMSEIAAARNHDGRLELFGVDAGGNPWHRSQAGVGSASWTDWLPLPAKAMVHITAATNADGRIQVVGVDPVGHVWQLFQAGPDASTYSTAWGAIDGELRA
jgi:hypothetical protein